MLSQLRPVFYRVGGQGDVRSGWINPTTKDVWTTKSGDETAIEIVPAGRPAFQTGERVEFTEGVDLFPHESVETGERGTVAGWSEETGEVGIFLEGFHSGLDDNTLLLVPFHDDALLRAFRPFRAPVAEQERRASLGWSLAVLLAALPLAFGLHLLVPGHVPSIVFGFAVLSVALVFGTPHALLLSCLSPLAHNLLVVEPEFVFTMPDAAELALAAFYVLLAVFVPWMSSLAPSLRRSACELSAVNGGKLARGVD